MILLIDNYDSFVHNLARYVRELGGEAVVRRNDAITLDEIAALAPSHIILSPGPCSPAEAGISTDVVRRFGPTIPILGVCLGHQCIGAAYGGDIVRAGRPVHGRTSLVTHDGSSVFTGLPSPLRVARYHSLVIARASLPRPLRVIASAGDDGEIMAVEHRAHPVVGVQFHPESAASEYGYAMLDRFLHGERARRTSCPPARTARARPPRMSRARRCRAASSCRRRWSWCGDGDVARPRAGACHRRVHDRRRVAGAVGQRRAAAAGRPASLGARSRRHARRRRVRNDARAAAARVFRLDRHLARLVQALAALEIPAPPELRDWVLDAVRAVGGGDASVRLTVTRGVGPGGVAPPSTRVRP